MSWLKYSVLTGEIVTLEPLEVKHEKDLIDVASDGTLWNKWTTSVPRPKDTATYIDVALNQKEQGMSLPYVVRCNTDGRLVGCTRFCNIDSEQRRLEIGYTWYAKSAQRTGVNTETKFLLLQQAFDQFECIAVEFRTHFLNMQSRNAIMRLGAKQDGVLRNHKVMDDGSYRDTVVFSIIKSEWAAVKRNLNYKMSLY